MSKGGASFRSLILAGACLVFVDAADHPQMLRTHRQPANHDSDSFLQIGPFDLGVDEINSIMKSNGIIANDLDWQSYDTNGDRRLSKQELQVAGIPVTYRTIMQKLTHELRAHLPKAEIRPRKESKSDMVHSVQSTNLFRKADVDGSGFLTEREIDHLLSVANIKRDDLDWRAYDRNKDGLLSQQEFLIAANDVRNHLAQRGPNNGSGPLSEISANSGGAKEHIDHLLSVANIKRDDLDWHAYDRNKDGLISQQEFLIAANDVRNHLAQRGPNEVSGSLSEISANSGGAKEPAKKQKRIGKDKQQDATMFKKYDADADGHIDAAEIRQYFLSEMIHDSPDEVKKDSNDGWDELLKLYDSDKDGLLSKQEFFSAASDIPKHLLGGKAGLHGRQKVDYGSSGSLSQINANSDGELQPANEHHTRVDDSVQMMKHEDEIFTKYDANADGYLDDNEIKNIPGYSGGFLADWHSFLKLYDSDKDGRLSEHEFNGAVKSLQSQVLKELSKDDGTSTDDEPLSESYSDSQGGRDYEEQDHEASLADIGAISNAEHKLPSEHDKKLQSRIDHQIFDKFDADGDGYLQSSEIYGLLKEAGNEGFSWRDHDLDGDGRLSETEFKAAGPAAAQHRAERNEAAELEQSLFQEADADKSSFLEDKEVNTLLHRLGVDPYRFNWRNYDRDKDGRLSPDEFLKAGDAAEKAAMGDVPSAEHAALLQDKSHDGSLDEEDGRSIQDDSEWADDMENSLLQRAGVAGNRVNWKNRNDDEDGRISREALLKAADVEEQAALGKVTAKSAEHAALLVDKSKEDDGILADQLQADDVENDGYEKGDESRDEADEVEGSGLQSGNLVEQDQDADDDGSDADPSDGDPNAKYKAWLKSMQDKGDPHDDPPREKRHRHHVQASIDFDGSGDPKADDDHRKAGNDDMYVFKTFDKNEDDVLDSKEIETLLYKAGVAHVPWKRYDLNDDGKLSKAEFANAAVLIKEHASAKFKNLVMRRSSVSNTMKMKMPRKSAGTTYFIGADADDSANSFQDSIDSADSADSADS